MGHPGSIVERQSAGVLVVDREAVVRFANPAAAELLGLSVDELLGETLGAPLIADGVTDLNVPGAGGAVRTIAMRVTPLDSDGEPRQLVTLFDVSGRARRYEHEHRLVERLQRSLLPQELPVVPGVSLAARYLPGAGDVEVGGDWYDAMPLANGQLGLAIGDVAGHGLESAALMGQLRSALRAYALEGHPPATVLQRLDALIEQLEPDRTATAGYLLYDPGDGRLTYACAGHPPPLVVGPDGSTAFLKGGRSLPLGAGSLGSRAQGAVTLEPGSSVVLYTDGLVERRSRPLNEGLEHLAVSAGGDARAVDDLCDVLLQRLVGADGGEDDIALLAASTVALDQARIALRLPTNAAATRTVRRLLERWLEGAGADVLERGEILLACHEACANTIGHAYGFADATYELLATRDDASVTVTIRDHGRWRTGPSAADRGRGLLLMRGLADEVAVRPHVDGTTVTLRRFLKHPSAV